MLFKVTKCFLIMQEEFRRHYYMLETNLLTSIGDTFLALVGVITTGVRKI